MENFRHWRSCGQVELGGRGRGWGGSKPNSSPPLICQTRQINIWVSQAEKRLHLGTDKSLTRGYEEGRGRWILWSPCLFALLLCNYRGGNADPSSLNEWKNKSSRFIYIISAMQQDKHFHYSKQIWGGLTITVLLSMHMRDAGSKCI